MKATLPPIAVETTNIPTTISCSLHNRHYFFIDSRVIPSVFIIHGCYIPFQFTLVTALYYFHRIYENDPLGNTPLSENDPPPKKKIRVFENDPSAKFPPSPIPPTALRLGIQEFTDPGLHWQDPAVLTSL